MLLLHGLGSTCHTWDLMAPLLSQRFRVLALDQRGHGESDKPDTGYDFATIAGDLAAFIDALALRHPLLMGHSWGGNVVLQYAATFPEIPAGLVLLDGGFLEPASHPGLTWERIRQEMAPADLPHLTPQELLEGARMEQPQLPWTAQIEAILLASFEALEGNIIRPRLNRDHRLQIVGALWEQRPSALYSRVRCPVLMLAARQDNPTPREAQFQAMKERNVAQAEALLPRRKTVWMENSVHDLQLQRPQEVARLILDAVAEGFFTP